MITPNKFITLDASVLAKLEAVMSQRSKKKIGLSELFRLLANRFESVDQFILAIDVLYVLNMVDVDPEAAMVSYVV